MAETDDAEVVEVNQNIPCEIYAIRGGRLAGSPTPRGYLTLTFDAIAYRRLSGLLMANLKGTMTMHVVDIQAPLDDDPDEAQPAVPKLTPQIPLPDDNGTETVTMSVNGVAAPVRTGKTRNGSRADDGWTLHAFKLNEETPGLCGICHHREDDDLHGAEVDKTLPHAFVPHDHDNQCDVCKREETYELHDLAKRPHIYESDPSDDNLTCAVCSEGPETALHDEAANAIVPGLAQTLLDTIEDDDEPVLLVNEEPQAVEVQA